MKTEWELWTGGNDIPKVEKSQCCCLKDEKATLAGYCLRKAEAGGHTGSGFRLSAIADYGFSTAVDDLVDDSVQLFFLCQVAFMEFLLIERYQHLTCCKPWPK